MKNIFGLLIVLLLSYWCIRPLMIPGYFPMHDDTQVARVVEMGRALREGQFPVRWVTNLGYGYGYPIFNFYGPLPYYIGGFLYAGGMPSLVATKIMMGLAVLLAGITMYLVVSKILGNTSAVVASALYMYAPYRAVDVYVRGAVGEYYALIFLPLLYVGFWQLNKNKQLSGIIVGSLGIAGVVLSHTILGYVTVGFALVVALMLHTRKYAIFMIVLGLGISSFFWLPAIFEMKFTNVASQVSTSANFRDHFVCIAQLWDSQWGFGGSAPGCTDGLSFKFGKIQLVVAIISLSLLAIKKLSTNGKHIVISGISIVLISIFFMTKISQPLWELIPMFDYVQYPWRFLAFSIFGLSLTGSAIMAFTWQRWIRIGLAIGIVIAVIMIESKRFEPQYAYGITSKEFETIEDIRFRASKISDEYLPGDVMRPKTISEIPRDIIVPSDVYSMELTQITNTYNKIAFRAEQEVTVNVNIAYFPGWHYWVNENEVFPQIRNGLPQITIPAGVSVVQFVFKNTFIRTLANSISVISIGILCLVYDKRKKIIS